MAIIQEFLDFTAEEIPVEKTFNIEGKDYRIQIDYNSYFDFYTCTIKDIDSNVLICNKLVYYIPVNDATIQGLDITKKIIPLNYDDPETEIIINKANFDKIKLYLVSNE